MPEQIELVQTEGGLCNRLRVLVGLAYVAELQGRLFDVLWEPDAYTNGSFASVYEPIPRLRVHERRPLNSVVVDSTIDVTEKLIRRLSGVRLTAAQIAPLYRRFLRPRPALRARIEAYRRQHDLDSCVGLWIRGTEHTAERLRAAGIEKLRPEHHFVQVPDAFFELIAGGPSEQRYYVATDDIATLGRLVKRFGSDRILNGSRQWTRHELRQNSLEDSVLNLHLLALCREFFGTFWSSFSNTVDYLRGTVPRYIPLRDPLREPERTSPQPACSGTWLVALLALALLALALGISALGVRPRLDRP